MMNAAIIAILCVILGCIIGGGFTFGRRFGKLEQKVKDLTDSMAASNSKQENLDQHIGKILNRLMRIEIKLGINKKE